MKLSVLSLALAATVCAGALGVGQAFATTSHHATKTLKIVMHDPGCHWFQINGKLSKSATVTAGHVRLVDLDEAALKVASRHGMRRIPMGRSIVVGRGNYVIMMVGQAVDDNYLKLTVR
jgi:hypothetical protein